MVAQVADILGQGIYTPAEAAFYARERTEVVKRWIRGDGTAKAVVKAQFEDERFISFLDFVQTLAISAIRRQYAVPLQTIRKAVEFAEEEFGMIYPFAREHSTYLLDRDQRGADAPREPNEPEERRWELFIEPPRGQGLLQLTGRNRGNLAMKEIVEPYLKNLKFNEEGLAREYAAYSLGGIQITMDPQRRFGEPLLPSGYTALAIADAIRTEGSVDAVCHAYGIERTEVELAYSYLDYLRVTPPRA